MTADVIGLQNQTVLGQRGQAGSGTNLGKTEFLNLLMTQMSNQDPLNPTDNEAFIQQLTMFANLEQLTNLGKQIDDLLMMTGANNAANAVSLLGKDIRVSGNQIKGPEAEVFYELPEDAHSVIVEVRKPGGEVAKILDDVPTAEGLQRLQIDDLPEGDYTIHVVAKRLDGTEIPTEISVTEHVGGVNFSTSVPTILASSGREISAADIVEIRQPPTQ